MKVGRCMPVPTEKSRVVRFGVFEADLQETELRKSGLRIKLQDQPFQILTMLLERPGETVTREELRKRLWPADTFVDFDHSLNSSIKKLREALGDDSENPRFIETLHRRGYRFIAPVDASVSVTAETREEYRAPRTWQGARAAKALSFKWALAAVAIVVSVLFGIRFLPRASQPRVVGSKPITHDALPKRSMVTDGSRIYFNEVKPPSIVSVAQVSVGGGEAAILDVPFADFGIAGVSSDQTELLMGGFDDSLWVVPLPAGPARRLSEVSGHAAAWLANGKLAFAKEFDIYLAEHDGSAPRKLKTMPDWPDWIRSSPDGTRLRFTLTHYTGRRISEIWEMRIDGSDLHPVLRGWNDPADECCGSWTPDGKYYIFQSTRGRASNIWIIREGPQWWRLGENEPVQLTTGPLQFERPILSRDGRKLFVNGLQQRAELVRYDFPSHEFVSYVSGISAADPDFSRDGQWITYVRFPDATLWRGKLDGSAQQQLTFPPMRAAIPHWSPNAEQIAFTGDMPGKPWKTYLVSRDGAMLRTLDNDNCWERDPSWSPDGNALVFSHEDYEGDEGIYIARFDLKTDQLSLLPGSKDIFAPRWSPNGRFIAAITHPLPQDKLMIYDMAKAEWRKLDLKTNGVGYLAWSHDSSYLYFDARYDNPGYYRLRVADLKLEHLFDLAKIRQFQDMFAGTAGSSWTGLGPGDVPLFVRDISTQEIYALDLELP